MSKMNHNIFCFHIEPARGCTRRCEFCGIQKIKAEIAKPTLMSIFLAKEIATQIKEDFKEKLRIDFSLHGEPLLNPDLPEIISIFREILPKAQLAVISNGDLLARGKVNLMEYFNSGLNYFMFDAYDRSDEEFAVLDNIFDDAEKQGIKFYDYFEDKKSIWSYNSCAEQAIIEVKDLSDTKDITRSIHTAGGNLDESLYAKFGVDKDKIPYLKQCGKPFTELSVNADGAVSICCEDWSRKNVVGNVLKGDKLIDIWNSDEMEQIRYLLHNKRRDLINVCSKCNVKTFRTGWLKPLKQFPNLITELEKRKNG